MILLTGATGFLGSHLLDQLLRRGDEVVALTRSTSSHARIRPCLANPALRLFEVDRNDPRDIFDRGQVDTIIHVATEYGRGDAPLYSILDANLILPLRLAELGIAGGVRCFINTDSFFNKYGNSYSNLLNYSLSKKSLLNWLEKLAGDLKIINVVLEHMYGPGDSESKFVESLIRKVALERVRHVPLTHGHQKRDFVHVDDVVGAYLKLVDYGRTQEFRFRSFELGTGTATQVRDFVSTIKNLSGSPTQLGFGEVPYRSDEIMCSTADTSSLEQLGWKPSMDVCAGIRDILEKYARKDAGALPS